MADLGITPILLQLAARRTGTTTKAGELGAFTPAQVGNIATKLIAAGRLWRVKTGHRTMTLYANKADADRETADRALRQRPAQMVTMKAARMTGTGEMIITPQTKITICPGWSPRFQAQEFPGIYGGNQRGRVAAPLPSTEAT